MPFPDPFTCDDDVALLARAVFDRTLPKREWTHRAHFATALWLLHARPEVDASLALPPAIRAYNEATGVANTATSGYHETITQASVIAARAFLARDRARALYATCNALTASPLGKSDWLLRYWSRERLFSIEARRAWLGPDIEEFTPSALFLKFESDILVHAVLD